MTPNPAVRTGIDEDDAVVSSEGEDLEYDSSSDFIPSDDESGETSRTHSSSPGQHLHRPRSDRRDAGGIEAHILWPDAHSSSLPGNVIKPHWKYHYYYPEHYSLCWENRNHILLEYREIFEFQVFRNSYPELLQLNIPRARREVIMKAHMDNQGSRLSPRNNRSICSGSRENPSECLILRYCLISEAPFLDFCFGYRFADSELASTAPKGQDDVTLGILYTNRYFRAQGLRILWQENTFLYTRSDEYTLLNTDQLMKLSQISSMRHLVIHQDCVWRPQMHYDRVLLNSILFAVSATEHFPALRSLRVDTVSTDTWSYCHERRKRVRDVLSEAQYFLRDMRAGRSVRQLRNVSITGVSDDDVGCLAVKIASFLVDPGEGSLGVRLVDVLSFSNYSGRATFISGRHHEMVYLNLEKVDGWLDRRRQQHGPHQKVFEWEDYLPAEMTGEA
ncbi:MAG: hypothetical protein Q9195_004200 [Heterodermia aff. obscurata]